MMSRGHVACGGSINDTMKSDLYKNFFSVQWPQNTAPLHTSFTVYKSMYDLHGSAHYAHSVPHNATGL